MDSKKVERKDGKVFEIGQIQLVECSFVNPNYKIELCSKSRITPTGHLPIAMLESNNKTLPRFTLRWDQKNRTVKK